ncbi:hypothetical protein AC578_10484 [Pseudocercospora eumusae]|uniref:Uncharacterized protein n=1 Tax=Pseudocercospora eumusae TaxID=321146 RepID=A0A139H8E5_9PEZI|nr:hypothetical protein AC578_10484 [Pseudocercospora eumusae]
MATVEPSHDTQSGLEVDGLLRAQSPVKDKKPALERHISHIPQDDEEDNAAAEDYLKPGGGFKDKIKSKLKKTVSRESRGDPADDKTRAASPPKGHTRSSSGLEVTGSMRIDSNEDRGEDHSDKPGLIRRLTKSPRQDEQPRKPKSPSKLERTISSIPHDDYDSDGEGPI